jgi:hypothetical protein
VSAQACSKNKAKVQETSKIQKHARIFVFQVWKKSITCLLKLVARPDRFQAKRKYLFMGRAARTGCKGC